MSEILNRTVGEQSGNAKSHLDSVEVTATI